MDDSNQNLDQQRPKKTKLAGSSSNLNMQQQNSQARMMQGSTPTPNIQPQIPQGMLMMPFFSPNPNIQPQIPQGMMMPFFPPNPNFQQQNTQKIKIPGSSTTPAPLPLSKDNRSPNLHQQKPKRMKLQDSSSTPASLPLSKDNSNPYSQQKFSLRTMMPGSFSTPVTLPLSTESMLQTIATKQTIEMDLYIQQQLNLLRRNIVGHAQQQFSSAIQSLESEGASIIRAKDEEIARVKDRVQRLEECIKIKERDLEACKTEAREKEAVAVSLKNALEQLKDGCFSSTRGTEGKGENEVNCKAEEPIGSFRHCKVCGFHESCMLMLPCKHVCSCKLCDVYLQTCPVCKSDKITSFEVFYERKSK